MWNSINKLLLSDSNHSPLDFLFRPKYLFILSHMRSRSTVLSHILGSNPQICGYSELQIPYTDQDSLTQMHRLISDELDCKISRKYLLDKILHDFELSENVLEITKPKVVFLLREPEGTFKSLINMAHITGKEWYKDPQKGLDYYSSRLLQLEKISEHLGGNYYFIESEDLVNRADSILDNLTDWLKLKKPLNKNYTLFQNTGKPTYGDPSTNIKSGKLEPTKGHPSIRIPPDILEQGQICYAKCKKALLNKQEWAGTD